MPLLQALIPEPHYWLRVRLDENSYPAGRAPRLEHFLPNAVDAVNLHDRDRARCWARATAAPSSASTSRRRPVDARLPGDRGRTPRRRSRRRGRGATTSSPRAQGRQHFVLDATAGTHHFRRRRARTRFRRPAATIVAAMWRHGGGAAGNEVEAGRGQDDGHADGRHREGDQPARRDRRRRRRGHCSDSSSKAPRELRSGRPRRHRARTSRRCAHRHRRRRRRRARWAAAIPTIPASRCPARSRSSSSPTPTRMPPRPSAELIRSVCQALDSVRLITTEVYVAAPAFIEVRIEARLLARAGCRLRRRWRRRRGKRLDEFLSPRHARVRRERLAGGALRDALRRARADAGPLGRGPARLRQRPAARRRPADRSAARRARLSRRAPDRRAARSRIGSRSMSGTSWLLGGGYPWRIGSIRAGIPVGPEGAVVANDRDGLSLAAAAAAAAGASIAGRQPRPAHPAARRRRVGRCRARAVERRRPRAALRPGARRARRRWPRSASRG